MSRLGLRRKSAVRGLSFALSCVLLGITACAQVNDDDAPNTDAAGLPGQGDAGVLGNLGDGGARPSSRGDAGSASASLDLGGIITDLGDLFTTDDAGARQLNGDAGSAPPPTGGGAWTLNADSFQDCPAEPPPIPIVGGLCAGVYFGCGWTNESGQQYSCVCDWIHWLCI